jgi:hypothetical protein
MQNQQLERVRINRMSRRELLLWQCERFLPLLQCTPSPEDSSPTTGSANKISATISTQDAWSQQYMGQWPPGQVQAECKSLLKKCEFEENPSEKQGYISVLL